VQNAAGVIKPQLIGWTLYLLLSVPAKLFAANAYGVAGVACVSAFIYALVVWPGAAIGYRKTLHLERDTKDQVRINEAD